MSMSASSKKERLYGQLSAELSRMTRALAHTTYLCEQLHVDLEAMKTLAALDAAKLMTVAAKLNPEEEQTEGHQRES